MFLLAFSFCCVSCLTQGDPTKEDIGSWAEAGSKIQMPPATVSMVQVRVSSYFDPFVLCGSSSSQDIRERQVIPAVPEILAIV